MRGERSGVGCRRRKLLEGPVGLSSPSESSGPAPLFYVVGSPDASPEYVLAYPLEIGPLRKIPYKVKNFHTDALLEDVG